MAYDAGMNFAVCRELDEKLRNAKIEKIYQLTKDELCLTCRAGGASVRLLISANAASAHIGLTTLPRENPTEPPMFCMQLRKYLTGGIIRSVRAYGFERVAEIAVDARDEMNFEVRRFLICEVMGKYSNIMFASEADKTGEEVKDTENGEGLKISGVLKTVDITTSRKRQVLPGMLYEMPPAQDKLSPLGETEEHFKAEALKCGDALAEKFLISVYSGMSSLAVNEIAYRANAYGIQLYKTDISLLWQRFSEFVDMIRSGGYTPTLISSKDGVPKEYAFFDVTLYGDTMVKTHFDTLSELFDAYYGEREKAQYLTQRSHDIIQILSAARKKLTKKAAILTQELADCAQADEYKVKGDLITASAYMLNKKADSVTVTDYYSEDLHSVTIPLDPKLSPMQNAAKYYKKYNKLKKGAVILAEQEKKLSSELEYLDTVEDALSRADNAADVAEIRTELSRTGYSTQTAIVTRMKSPAPKPMRFVTSGGYELICGKNNTQNDFVTFKLSKKSDWWFHVKSAHGSHVLLVCDPGIEPDAEDFTQAAQLAAYYSSERDSENVAVDYTLIRNVKKPPASNPGYVTYSSNYTAYVTPRLPETKNKK